MYGEIRLVAKLREIIWVLIKMFLLSSLILISSPSFSVRAEAQTMVRLIPEYVVSHFTGEELTFACVVENVINLIGIEILMSWNTTYLFYATHTATIPVEDYPTPIPPSPYSGILHSPIIEWVNRVNEQDGTYECVFSWLLETPFNGSGTVFTITFWTFGPYHVPFVDTALHFESIRLAGVDGEIEFTATDASVRILRWDVDNHDIAVQNVSTSKTGCLPIPAVGKGNPVDVIVYVENQGDYTEIFDTRIYADATLIGELQDSAIAQGVSATVTVTSDTSHLSMGNYTVSAIVETVSGDIEPTDNSMIDGLILVTISGDVDADFDVDIYDVVKMCMCYGSQEGDPEYDANCDVDGDEDIDIYDIVILCNHYGETYP